MRAVPSGEPDFDAETAVVATTPGRYRADLDPSWSVIRGPNGGYVAAIVLRAMLATVDDTDRAPRSLTVHYVAPATEREAAEVVTRIERSGRSMTSCSARMTQGGRLVAIAVGAFSAPRPGPELCDLRMPDVDSPDQLPRVPPPEGAPPIARRWDAVHAIGALPFDGAPSADEAVGGAWLRLPEGHVVDAAVIAAVTDAWVPPIFAKVADPIVVPTVDLTVHFRSRLPYPGATRTDYVLARFRTTVVADGFLEEDGEVWSPGGQLLAQSRQLAAVLPMP